MLGRFDSLVSFPDKYVPSFLEWTLNHIPSPPRCCAAALRDWLAQHWGPVQRCPVPLITQPEGRSQGPRVVPGS